MTAAPSALRRLPWRLFWLPLGPDGNDVDASPGMFLAHAWHDACGHLDDATAAALREAATTHRTVPLLTSLICRDAHTARLKPPDQLRWLVKEITDLSEHATGDTAAAIDAIAHLHPGRDWRAQLQAARRRLNTQT